jgi:hypothetical protein
MMLTPVIRKGQFRALRALGQISVVEFNGGRKFPIGPEMHCGPALLGIAPGIFSVKTSTPSRIR